LAGAEKSNGVQVTIKMFETFSMLPLAFWVVALLLIGGAIRAISHLRDGSGLPMLAVLGTVAVWYVGDAFYNDYANYHAKLFDGGVLRSAWWQVAWFLVVLLAAAPWIHRWLNARQLSRSSGVLQLYKCGVGQPAFQRQLTRLFYGCVVIWVILCTIAAFLLRDQILFFFFPFLGELASPWSHARLGAGLDFLSVVAIYLQILVTGMFGVVAALSTQRRICRLALLCCLLSWPYFLFAWARNMMLAIVIPGMLSWIFLRMRGGMLKRLAVLGACFLLVNAWMGFVIANRSEMSTATALKERGFSLDEKVHHEGLNMFEELCWINTFMKQGTYRPNWGTRYFAELVNPIPRGIWHDKPLIGIDYSIARGQAGGAADAAGVYASISTGMIGQGVVNFSRVLGPAFAALLMSFWVAVLARLDLNIQKFGRLPLYAVGIILTFNLGRDITFITLYPFVFGAALIWWVERQSKQNSGKREAEIGVRPPAANGPRPVFSSRSRHGLIRKPKFTVARRVSLAHFPFSSLRPSRGWRPLARLRRSWTVAGKRAASPRPARLISNRRLRSRPPARFS
jgi:hypothetical protein